MDRVDHENDNHEKSYHKDFSRPPFDLGITSETLPVPSPPSAPSAPSPAGEVDKSSDKSSESGMFDNAPRPPTRPGDIEHDAAPGLEEVPGAGPGHWHGQLGLGPDGMPLVKPTPLPSNSNTDEFKRQAHMGQCYNAAKSDSIPLDRQAPDTRPEICKMRHRSYPNDLQRASVVIVFHNEVASILLRSVHSVLNQSPQGLLQEIILVDDASVADPGTLGMTLLGRPLGKTLLGDTLGMTLLGRHSWETLLGDTPGMTLLGKTLLGDNLGKTLLGDTLEKTLLGDTLGMTLLGRHSWETLLGDTLGMTLLRRHSWETLLA
eukprot:s765_g38.t1